MNWDVRHGDWREVLRDAAPRTIPVFVTDPPYGTGWARTAKGSSIGEFVGINERPEWDVWGEDWITEARRVGSGGAFLLPRTRLADASIAVPDARFAFYVKTNPRPNGPVVEPVIFWGSVKSPSADVRAYNGDTPFHPCQKPIEVMEWMLGGVAPGTLVIDPFCGSGSTGVAAVRLGLPFLGIEQNPEYVTIARQRIAAAAAQTSLGLEAA